GPVEAACATSDTRRVEPARRGRRNDSGSHLSPATSHQRVAQCVEGGPHADDLVRARERSRERCRSLDRAADNRLDDLSELRRMRRRQEDPHLPYLPYLPYLP